jgi:hypothetical protein
MAERSFLRLPGEPDNNCSLISESSASSRPPIEYILTTDGLRISETYAATTTVRSVPVLKRELSTVLLKDTYTEEEMLQKIQKMIDRQKRPGFLGKIKKLFLLQDDKEVTVVYMTAEEAA